MAEVFKNTRPLGLPGEFRRHFSFECDHDGIRGPVLFVGPIYYEFKLKTQLYLGRYSYYNIKIINRQRYHLFINRFFCF